MDLTTLVLLATVSVNGELEAKGAGYGVPLEGFPSLEEWRLHLWTNAARVDPSRFTDEYSAGGCSTDEFSEDELTAKAPLYMDLDLTEVSREHSTDMAENGCFQHESCDGTDTFARIAQYYDDTSYVGENIAYGSSDAKYSVLSMWMCSHDGHRGNIMSGDWNELGPGVDGSHMTQDFGAGTLENGEPPVRSAADYDGVFFVDWGDAAAPEALSVVAAGVEYDVDLAFGTEENGVYVTTDLEPDSSDCTPWWVHWQKDGGESGAWPAQGSYLYGACDEEWTDGQTPRDGLFGDVDEDDLHGEMIEELKLSGCSAVPGSAGLGAVLGAAALLVRRRRA